MFLHLGLPSLRRLLLHIVQFGFDMGKSMQKSIGDAFFYLVIVWKLSIVLTDFDSVLRSPLAIIYFHGGVVGFYLGLAIYCREGLMGHEEGAAWLLMDFGHFLRVQF